MNALVDIYLDNNLGDDIMGQTIIEYLKRKGIKCYLLANDDFTYSNFINGISDVDIIEDISKSIIQEKKIDFYIRVGGSMFPHNTSKEGILRYVTLYKYRMMKKNGVKIYILGCNVGPFKSSIGIKATRNIIKLCELITCRDKETFNFISKIKKNDFFMFPDIVFTRKDLINTDNRQNDVLGISTYTAYTSHLKKYNLSFSNMMSNIINSYLEKKQNGKVKMFVFDSGYNSDYPTTHRILQGINNKDRVEIVSFDGDIFKFMNEYNKCSTIIGARFHSIVLSLLCNIPVLPIIYSNKTRNILKDLNYNGEIIQITQCEDVNIEEVVNLIFDNKNLLDYVEPKIFEDSKGHLKVLSKYLTKI